jgi:hypothetical protein
MSAVVVSFAVGIMTTVVRIKPSKKPKTLGTGEHNGNCVRH